MDSNQTEPARLVLVFSNADDRDEFFKRVVRSTVPAEDRRDAVAPAWSLVRNWRTEGGDHVPL